MLCLFPTTWLPTSTENNKKSLVNVALDFFLKGPIEKKANSRLSAVRVGFPFLVVLSETLHDPSIQLSTHESILRTVIFFPIEASVRSISFNQLFWHKDPGGYSGFQVMGIIEWGQKSKPQKLPGPKIKPRKIPRQISEPLKFPERIILYLENYAAGICGHYPWGTTVNLIFRLFWIPKKNPYLIKPHKKILAKFSYPKTSQNWKFLTHSRHLKSGVPPMGTKKDWKIKNFSKFYNSPMWHNNKLLFYRPFKKLYNVSL